MIYTQATILRVEDSSDVGCEVIWINLAHVGNNKWLMMQHVARYKKEYGGTGSFHNVKTLTTAEAHTLVRECEELDAIIQFWDASINHLAELFDNWIRYHITRERANEKGAGPYCCDCGKQLLNEKAFYGRRKFPYPSQVVRATDKGNVCLHCYYTKGVRVQDIINAPRITDIFFSPLRHKKRMHPHWLVDMGEIHEMA